MNSNAIYESTEVVLQQMEAKLRQLDPTSSEYSVLAAKYNELLDTYVKAEKNQIDDRKNYLDKAKANGDHKTKLIDIGVTAVCGILGSTISMIMLGALTQKSFDFDLQGVHTSYTGKNVLQAFNRLLTKKI